MKCCMSTDVGTWTNWLTFEPNPDHSPDAGTGLFSPISYRLRNFAALPRLRASCAATRNFTSRKSTYTYWQRAARASHGFKMFIIHCAVGRHLGGKCALLSALLVSTDVGFFFTVTAVYPLLFIHYRLMMKWKQWYGCLYSVRSTLYGNVYIYQWCSFVWWVLIRCCLRCP